MKPLFELLFILCICGAESVFAGGPSSTDYAVWSAVVDSSRGDVYLWHMTEPFSVYSRGETFETDESRTYRLAENASNQPPTKLRAELFKTRATVHLLNSKSLTAIVGKRPRPTWLLCPRAIAGAAGIYRLSSPAYSADGNTAYFLCCDCSIYFGSVELNVVVKDAAGEWHPQFHIIRDFVDWDVGSGLNED